MRQIGLRSIVFARSAMADCRMLAREQAPEYSGHPVDAERSDQESIASAAGEVTAAAGGRNGGGAGGFGLNPDFMGGRPGGDSPAITI